MQEENTKQARLPVGNTSLPMMAKAVFSAILRRVFLVSTYVHRPENVCSDGREE